MCFPNFCLALIAIIIPPLPVCIKRGCCSADMLINVALCLLGFIPGLIHAWYIISITPDFNDYEDIEAGRRPRYVDQAQPRHANPAPRNNNATAPQQRMQAPPANNGVPALKAAQQQTYGAVNGEGSSSDVPPPPYSEGIVGDHKVQKQ